MDAERYAQYLRSPHWRNIREDALRQRGGRCEVCQSSCAIHVHHRTYERLGHEVPDDLRVLCEACHHLIHDLQRQHQISLADATDRVTATACSNRYEDDDPIPVQDILTVIVRQMEQQ